jgi:hypothetical protein
MTQSHCCAAHVLSDQAQQGSKNCNNTCFSAVQPTTLEAEGQQGSVPLAEAVEAYARAQRGPAGRAEPSERSVSFAGDCDLHKPPCD